MVTYPFVWYDVNRETPDGSNDVLVLTRQGHIAIAAPSPDMADRAWPDSTWRIKIGIDSYEVWDYEKHGEIAFWAEIPMDSRMLEPYR